MVRLRPLYLSLLILVLLGCGLGYYALWFYQPVPVDPRWELTSDSTIPEGAVTVRFTGTSTLLFSDGESRWMVDGWFSRPAPLALAFGKISPDLAAIERGLAANQVSSLDALFVLHSHFDHAMDAPEVAKRTGALLLGSESTANIARGWGLPETQILTVADRQQIHLGRFVITPIESHHFQFTDATKQEIPLAGPFISKPLVPPVAAFNYRVGNVYILHVSHPRGSFLIVGSASWQPDQLQGLHADVVFLNVGGIGSQTADYRERYWRETVGMVSPDRVIPIHFDSLTGPVEGAFRGPVNAIAVISGGLKETRTFLQHKEMEQPQIRFQTLPRFDEVVLFK